MKKALAFGAVPVVFLLVTAFQSSNSVPAQLAAILSEVSSLKSGLSDLKTQVASLEGKGGRQYYQTKTTHIAISAPNACAAGYHFASLWEIKDPSSLRYNTELGLTTFDSHLGPPSNSYGWVRTGGLLSLPPATAGVANCFGWESTAGDDQGTIVGLGQSWVAPASQITPWLAEISACNQARGVWCVQD